MKRRKLKCTCTCIYKVESKYIIFGNKKYNSAHKANQSEFS